MFFPPGGVEGCFYRLGFRVFSFGWCRGLCLHIRGSGIGAWCIGEMEELMGGLSLAKDEAGGLDLHLEEEEINNQVELSGGKVLYRRDY